MRNASNPRQGCALPRSADLAGRAVAIAPSVPAAFDTPLAAHHKAIGRWAAKQAYASTAFARIEARRYIENAFDQAVLEILAPIALTNLRVAVLVGGDDRPPSIAIICDDIGQIELGWIEKTNLLSDTLFGSVAPVGWRAAAYSALESTLGTVLTIFNFQDMLEELSMYYWDGDTTDEAAREHMVEWRGMEPDELDEMLPSEVEAKRPDFMTDKPDALKRMPAMLSTRLRNLRAAHAAHMQSRFAWQLDGQKLFEYFPELEESTHLAPLTLVPFDQFARELDDIGRPGMEMGFMNVAGLVELENAERVGEWFASFKLGIDVLRAAQDLIEFDPAALAVRA